MIAAAACYSILTHWYIRLLDGWKTVYAVGSLAAAVLAALFGFRFALKPKSGGKRTEKRIENAMYEENALG